MIAEGQVFPDRVGYNALPWKYAAGTPNILGAIVSAQALRLLLDLALTPAARLLRHGQAIERAAVRAAMDRIAGWNQQLTGRALDRLGAIHGITIYGPRDPARRTSLVAFNLAGRDPMHVAQALNRAGIEASAGCHCATLAHHALGLTPPASCRLSFYLYNTPEEIDQARRGRRRRRVRRGPALPVLVRRRQAPGRAAAPRCRQTEWCRWRPGIPRARVRPGSHLRHDENVASWGTGQEERATARHPARFPHFGGHGP